MTTAAQLIVEAYKLSQVIDPREEIQGYQQNEGLIALNRIINQWTSLDVYIPTVNTIEVVTSPGEAEYRQTGLPIIVDILEAHLVDQNNVQFLIRVIDIKEFNVLNFDQTTNRSRPTMVFLKNFKDNITIASDIIVFPIPDAIYNIRFTVKSNLTTLTYSQEFEDVPEFWLCALQFELAKQLAILYRIPVSTDFKEEYDRIMQEVKAASKRDMTVQNTNPFLSNRRYRPWGCWGG